jgi:hypothetical protein
MPIDLGAHRVIVPSSFASRLIQEELAKIASGQAGQLTSGQGNELEARRPKGSVAETAPSGILLPEFQTPDKFLNWGDNNLDVATKEACLLAWIEVLTSPAFDRSIFPDLFPAESTSGFTFDEALKFAIQLMQIRDQLGGSAKVHGFASVAATLGETSGRWHDLAALESAYLDVLSRSGKEDHNKVRADLATGTDLPENVTDVWLVGLLDPQPLLLEALERRQDHLNIHILVGADEAESGLFDAWGRPDPARWAGRALTWPKFTESVHLVRDPEHGLEKLSELLGGKAPEHGVVAIAPCERERYPGLLTDRLRSLGAEAVNPLGELHADHAIHHSARTMLDLVESRTFASLRRALLHPTLVGNLLRQPIGFTALNTLLDALSQMKPPQDLAALLAHLDKLAEPDKSDRRATYQWNQVQSLKPLLREIVAHVDRLNDLTPELLCAEILKLAQERSGKAEALEIEFATQVSEAVENTLFALDPGNQPALELRASHWVRLALRLAGEKRFRQNLAKQPVNLPGWMEAPWEPVPHLIVFGLTDDLIPSATHAHAFLPAKLRSQLGLATPERHFANAAYTLEKLRRSRETAAGDRSQGRLDIIVPRLDSNGDGLRPSRLLFQCPDEELAGRVNHLFEEDVATEEQPYWQIPQNLKLTPAARPGQAQAVRKRLSATSFRDYLANPADFWLKHALGMRETSHDDLELDRAGFGTLIHAALERFGKDESMRDCQDVQAIAKRVSECLDQHFEAVFGQEHEPGLIFQRETARERLLAFAPLQARLVAEGWRTVKVEGQLPALDISGLEIGGRYDRLDHHAATDSWRVYDYKSFDTVQTPESKHVKKHRKGNRETPEFEYQVTVTTEKTSKTGKTKTETKVHRYRWDDLQLPVYYRNLFAGDPRIQGKPLEVGYIILPAKGEAVAEIWPKYAGDIAGHATLAINNVVKKILENKPENFAPIEGKTKHPVLAALSRRQPADYMDIALLGTVRAEETPGR